MATKVFDAQFYRPIHSQSRLRTIQLCIVSHRNSLDLLTSLLELAVSEFEISFFFKAAYQFFVKCAEEKALFNAFYPYMPFIV